MGILRVPKENLPWQLIAPFTLYRGIMIFFSDLQRELEFDLEGHHFFVTHGHNYYVSMDLESIKDEGIARGADVVVFGHTHRPVVKESDGIYLLNPGSLSYPRQEGRRPSYLVITADENDDLCCEIKYL